MPIWRSGFRVVILSLVVASMVWSAPISFAALPQQPAPAPNAEEESPEARADRDLEELGDEKAREQASEQLKDALNDLQAEPCPKPGDPAVEKLRDAIRYYARAHRLPSSLANLRAAFAVLRVPRSGVGGRGTQSKRLGASGHLFMDMVNWLYDLDKAAAQPCTPPPKTVSAAEPGANGGGLSRNAKLGAGAGLVVIGGGALLLGGDSGDNGVGNQPDFSGLSGSFNTTMIVRCAQQQSSTMVPVTMTVSTAEASCTDASQQGPCRQCTKSKGGLPVPCTIDKNGRYHGIFSGPISNLFFVQNGANIRWAWLGNIFRGAPARLNADSTIDVNSPGASPCSQLAATMTSN